MIWIHKEEIGSIMCQRPYVEYKPVVNLDQTIVQSRFDEVHGTLKSTIRCKIQIDKIR